MADSRWQNAYLIFLLTIMVMLVTLFMLPPGIVEKSENNEKVKVVTPAVVRVVIEAFVMGLGLLTFTGNVSIAVSQIDAQYAALSGYAMSIYMAGAMVAGLLITVILKTFKKYTMCVGLLLSVAGLLCLAFAPSPATIILCAVLFGLGFGIYMTTAYSTIPDLVPRAAITMAISLFGVGLNVGCLVNPFIITSGAALINDKISTRFLLAALIMLVTTVSY